MQWGARSHTAQGRTGSGYNDTYLKTNVYSTSPYSPRPAKAHLQDVNVKMIDLKMHECWKVKKPTGKQQPGGDLPVRTWRYAEDTGGWLHFILYAVLVGMIPFAKWHQLTNVGVAILNHHPNHHKWVGINHSQIGWFVALRYPHSYGKSLFSMGKSTKNCHF